MVGYHYTSKRNLDSILKHGLKPYPIRKDTLLDYFDVYPMGVWLWEHVQDTEEELGTVLFQISEKGCLEVVKLEVQYERSDLLFDTNRRLVRMFHDGNVGIWTYHDGSQSSVVSVNKIPPSQIKLVRTFDARDIVIHSKVNRNTQNEPNSKEAE